MNRNSSAKSFVFLSNSGCLLPLLIIFNLFFGWIFFKPMSWLFIEAVLILLFMISSYFSVKKVLSSSRKHKNTVDTKGEIVEDN